MRSLIFISGMLLLWACGGKKEDPQLRQAADVHIEALGIAREVNNKLDVLEETAVSQDSVVKLRSLLEEWEGSLVEVEGFEDHDHDHHHDHDHDHDHSHEPNCLEGLEPSQILAIQQEFKQEIERLRERVSALETKPLE